jgi:hypothetical protein
MNIITPKTALGKGLERALLLSLSVFVSTILKEVTMAPIVYLVVKSSLDFLNSNIPNTSK